MITAEVLLPSEYTIPDWAVFSALFLFAWIAIMLSAFRNKIGEELRAVFNPNILRRLYEIYNQEYARYTLAANLYFFVILGIFFRFLNLHYGIGEDLLHPVLMLLVFAGSVVILYLVKTIIYRIIGFLARIQKSVREYVFSFFLLHRFLGLLLTPLAFLLLLIHPDYVPVIFYISGIIGCGWLIFLVIRLFVLLGKNRIHFISRVFFFLLIELTPLSLLMRYLYDLVAKY